MFGPPLPFSSHGTLRGGHAQTIAGATLPCAAPRLGDRDDCSPVGISVGENDQLEAWFHRGSSGETILLCHGLGGSVDSPYLRRTFDQLVAEQHSVLAVAQRGSGGALERTTRPYMTGNTHDLACVLRWLRGQVAAERVGAVGYSISGNTLLKLLGEGTPASDLPDYAIAVAPPIDLDEASRDLGRPRSRAYELWILRACRRWIPRLRGDFEGPIHVPPWSSFRAFDERYITPVWNFDSLDDYYGTASSRAHLPEIQTPTLILQAADDPVVDARHIQSAAVGPGVRIDMQPSGGHLGYIARDAHRSTKRRWLADAIAYHVRSLSPKRAGAAHTEEEEHACAAR